MSGTAGILSAPPFSEFMCAEAATECDGGTKLSFSPWMNSVGPGDVSFKGCERGTPALGPLEPSNPAPLCHYGEDLTQSTWAAC